MEIGPVDVVVLGFPGNRFNGTILPALSDLVSSGTICLLDLMFVDKDADGAVGALELKEIDAEHGPVPVPTNQPVASWTPRTSTRSRPPCSRTTRWP